MAVKCSQKELLFPCVRWYLPHQDLGIWATKKRLKDEKPMRKKTPTRSFKPWPFLSPKWKPLILWKGHLTIQNEVTKNCQEGKTHTNILHQGVWENQFSRQTNQKKTRSRKNGSETNPYPGSLKVINFNALSEKKCMILKLGFTSSTIPGQTTYHQKMK